MIKEADLNKDGEISFQGKIHTFDYIALLFKNITAGLPCISLPFAPLVFSNIYPISVAT